MKRFCFLLTLALSLLIFTGYAQTTPARPLQVALVVFPGVENLDLTEPLDVLLIASSLTSNGYYCYTVGLTDSLLTTARGGLHLRPDYTFQTMPKPDIVIVPGASPTRIEELVASPALVAQLRALAPHTPLMMSVCTGGLLLGAAGVLDGHRATTHSMALDALAKHSKITVVRGVRYVADGPVLTTAGITAGIDGTLALVEKYSGRVVADAVAEVMEYTRPGPRRTPPAGARKPTTAPRPRAMAMPKAMLAKKPAAKATPALASPNDPVCHMATASTMPQYTYHGKIYGFCSQACRRVFVDKPERYLP